MAGGAEAKLSRTACTGRSMSRYLKVDRISVVITIAVRCRAQSTRTH